MLKLSVGCSGVVIGKLNQWKICIGHYALFKYRKVIIHDYPCINVLSAATLAC